MTLTKRSAGWYYADLKMYGRVTITHRGPATWTALTTDGYTIHTAASLKAMMAVLSPLAE